MATESICSFCNLGLAKGEIHEEFNFYKHPAKKDDLRKLQLALKKVGRDGNQTTQDYVDTLATQRRIKSSRGLVMPAYGRLCDAFQWLLKLEEHDRNIDQSRPDHLSTAPSIADLPF